MAAIEAITKGSLGAGQATGKPNAAPVTGFGLLFAVSSETPATTEGPAFASGQTLPTTEHLVTEVDAMLGEGVDPLVQAQPDPEWSFASIAADAETGNDLMVGLEEITGVTMPSPLPGAEADAALVALGMTPSLPLDSEDAEQDVVLLDEVDDPDPTLVLAAPFAALLPDPALAQLNTETNPKDAPLQSLDFEPSLSLQNPKSAPNDLDQVFAPAGPNVNAQADTKAGVLQSLVHEASATLQGVEGPSASLLEPSVATFEGESQGKAGPASALPRAVSSSPLDPMTTDGLPVEPSPVSDIPQGHDASLLSPSTQPVKTTVARMTINPTAISPSAPFAATEPVVALEEPVKVRMSPDTSQIAAEKVDPFASGSKTQPVSGTSAPNLATILPENVSELPTPSAAGPMMAQLRQTLDTRDAAWRERLVTQVIGDARDGAQSVKITLRPKSLGDIQLNIEISRSETTVRIITETASAARLLLANEDLLSHLMDQSGVRLTSMTAQAAAPTGWLGQANGQSTSQNSGGQSGRDGAGGRKDRARGAEAARAEPAATLKLGDSSQLSINLMA
jgi:flagellar hook-length control protein FliK